MISQPSLSKTIRLLENELGYSLFDRKGKNIYLNNNGKILLKYTNSIFNAISDAKMELSVANQAENGTVTLSFMAASKLLPQIISGFKELHPNINMIVKQQSYNDSSSDCDLYVYSSRKPVQIPNSYTLLKEDCLLAISKSNPLAAKESISLADLRYEHFILMQEKLPLSDMTYDLCHHAGFDPVIGLCCDDRDTIFSMITMNLGVAFIPSVTWHNYLNQENIAFLPVKENSYRYIHMAWKSDGYISPSVSIMKTYIKDFFTQQF